MVRRHFARFLKLENVLFMVMELSMTLEIVFLFKLSNKCGVLRASLREVESSS